MDGAGFDALLDFPVVDHLDTANLGKRHAVVMREMKSGLGKGEAIIAIMPTEPRKTRGFACFTTAEKGFESQIKTSGHVLQDLRMHVLEGRTFSFQDRKRIDLRVARQALSTCSRKARRDLGKRSSFAWTAASVSARIKGLIVVARTIDW